MTRDPFRAVTLGLCLCPLHGVGAQAAELPRPDEATDYLAPTLMADARPRWTPDRRDKGAAWGGFMVWPAATLSVLADSNPFQRHGGGNGNLGVRFAPSLLAERDSGVHSTTLYGLGDAKLYPADTHADTVNGRVGVLHDWAPRRDFIVRLQGEVTRHTDPFDTLQIIPGATGRGTLEQTHFIGSTSVQKTFDHLFVTLSGTALRSNYDTAGTNASSFLSGETAVNVKGRAGYWLASSLYLFAEPSANWRTLDTGDHGSHGTRVVAGVGTERIGPSNGELFAGYQEQKYSISGTRLSGAVAGGRLSWTPTRAWRAIVQIDQSLGQVAVGTVADTIGTPTRQTSVAAKLRYEPSPLWSAEATAGSVWLDYVGTARNDQLIFGSLRVDYAISRCFDLTAEFHSTSLESTIGLASYRRTTATLGATYHY